MALSQDPVKRANQLANLRFLWKDPERHRAVLAKTGIGKLPKCQAKKKDGTPCKKVAAFGTPRCVTHGARCYKGTPPSPEKNKATSDAIAYLTANPAPPDLAGHPEYLRSQDLRMTDGKPHQARLRAAWQTGTDTGDWKAWRNLTK